MSGTETIPAQAPATALSCESEMTAAAAGRKETPPAYPEAASCHLYNRGKFHPEQRR
jgi:hypothetical protein